MLWCMYFSSKTKHLHFTQCYLAMTLMHKILKQHVFINYCLELGLHSSKEKRCKYVVPVHVINNRKDIVLWALNNSRAEQQKRADKRKFYYLDKMWGNAHHTYKMS
jgi:hypothetical protein